MYDNFDNFDEQPKEPVMTEDEKKAHKKIFSRIFFAFFAYMAITYCISVATSFVLHAIDKNLLDNNNFIMILSAVIEYVIALPILFLMLKKIPKQAPTTSPIKIRTFWKYATVSVFFMYVGNYISSYLMFSIEQALGKAPENAVNTMLDNTSFVLSLVIAGIIGPIIEEIMFRKWFTDRLTPYGDKIAIFVPALIFALFHGNFYQFFYAFLLGMTFSYIYVRTGKLIYTCILHIFINVFFGVLPSFFLSGFDLEEFIELTEQGTISEAYLQTNQGPLIYLSIYSIAMMLMLSLGIFHLIRNVRNIVLNKGSTKLPKGEGADIIFFNVGAILLIAVCLIFMAINTFDI